MGGLPDLSFARTTALGMRPSSTAFLRRASNSGVMADVLCECSVVVMLVSTSKIRVSPAHKTRSRWMTGDGERVEVRRSGPRRHDIATPIARPLLLRGTSTPRLAMTNNVSPHRKHWCLTPFCPRSPRARLAPGKRRRPRPDPFPQRVHNSGCRACRRSRVRGTR